MKKVSIAMRSRNDAEYVRSTIEAILKQDFTDFEFLSFDNASTDGTAEIIAEYPMIKRFHIPDGTYIPGKNLNEYIAECNGEIIVFNNADSVVQNSQWLRNLIEPILSERAAACYARQTCRPDADLWVWRDYEWAFPSKKVRREDFFSNASSAILKSVVLETPFDNAIRYSEDTDWAKKISLKGYKIEYVPTAVVEHSHNYTLEQTKKRFTGEGVADAQIFKSAQPFFSYIKGIASVILKDFIYAIKHNMISKFPDALAHRFVQKPAYYKARLNTFKELSR